MQFYLEFMCSVKKIHLFYQVRVVSLQNLDIVKMKIFRACTQCYPTIILVPVNLIGLIRVSKTMKQTNQSCGSFHCWKSTVDYDLFLSLEKLTIEYTLFLVRKPYVDYTLFLYFREEQTVINDKVSDNAFVHNREKIISKASVVNFYSYSFPWTSSSVPSNQS